ncbi:hypothetical protein V6Z11_A12G194800 [Gossypium hirsutum]
MDSMGDLSIYFRLWIGLRLTMSLEEGLSALFTSAVY